jgi:hypothetical protein
MTRANNSTTVTIKQSAGCSAVRTFFRDYRSRGFGISGSTCLPIILVASLAAQFGTASPAGITVTLEGTC